MAPAGAALVPPRFSVGSRLNSYGARYGVRRLHVRDDHIALPGEHHIWRAGVAENRVVYRLLARDHYGPGLGDERLPAVEVRDECRVDGRLVELVAVVEVDGRV